MPPSRGKGGVITTTTSLTVSFTARLGSATLLLNFYACKWLKFIKSTCIFVGKICPLFSCVLWGAISCFVDTAITSDALSRNTGSVRIGAYSSSQICYKGTVGLNKTIIFRGAVYGVWTHDLRFVQCVTPILPYHVFFFARNVLKSAAYYFGTTGCYKRAENVVFDIACLLISWAVATTQLLNLLLRIKFLLFWSNVTD